MSIMSQIACANLSAQNWRSDAFVQISSRLSPPSKFPCVFSQNAFKRELLLFSFVEDASDDALAAAAIDLRHYVELCDKWDGNINNAHPLLIVFAKKAISSQKLSEYHSFGWKILQYLHMNDVVPWPDGASHDPHLPFWSMCFHGMQIFVNMSCPAHVVRKSRVLGDYFILVVNPRERFDIVAGETREGRKIRSEIRRRVMIYDGTPHCMQLGSYNSGQLEWSQYGIVEENRERTDRCPFRFAQEDDDSEISIHRERLMR